MLETICEQMGIAPMCNLEQPPADDSPARRAGRAMTLDEAVAYAADL